jgi:hypothetical protein
MRVNLSKYRTDLVQISYFISVGEGVTSTSRLGGDVITNKANTGILSQSYTIFSSVPKLVLPFGGVRVSTDDINSKYIFNF